MTERTMPAGLSDERGLLDGTREDSGAAPLSSTRLGHAAAGYAAVHSARVRQRTRKALGRRRLKICLQ